MALEVVIGLTPIGIADAIGVDTELLYTIASISLSIPVVIWVLMIVIRTRMKEEPTYVRSRWQMGRKGWIALGVGTVVTILLLLFYSLKGLIIAQVAVTSLLIISLCIGIGAWLSLRSNRQ